MFHFWGRHTYAQNMIWIKVQSLTNTMRIHEKYWLRLWPPNIQCGSIPPWHELIIATKNTQWSYEMIKHSHEPIQCGSMWQSIHQHAQMISYATWETQFNMVNSQPRVFVPIPTWYESSHVNRCFHVKHGRNHLITGHWGKPLKSVRKITNDVNVSKGTLVHSSEFE